MTDAIVDPEDEFDVSLSWLVDPLDSTGGPDDLAESVKVALGSDRLAALDDVLPNIGDDDRRGFWGDTEAETLWRGWPVGSRIWLLSRAKITGPKAREGATIARVEQYIREALQPFIDLRIASRLVVKAQRDGLSQISSQATLYRGPRGEIALAYQYLWSEIRS